MLCQVMVTARLVRQSNTCLTRRRNLDNVSSKPNALSRMKSNAALDHLQSAGTFTSRKEEKTYVPDESPHPRLQISHIARRRKFAPPRAERRYAIAQSRLCRSAIRFSLTQRGRYGLMR